MNISATFYSGKKAEVQIDVIRDRRRKAKKSEGKAKLFVADFIVKDTELNNNYLRVGSEGLNIEMIQGNERLVSLTGHDENRECKCPSAPLLKGAKATREEAQELVEMFLVNKIRSIGRNL